MGKISTPPAKINTKISHQIRKNFVLDNLLWLYKTNPQYPTTWEILPKLNWEIFPVRSEASGSDVDDSQGDSRGSLEVICLGKGNRTWDLWKDWNWLNRSFLLLLLLPVVCLFCCVWLLLFKGPNPNHFSCWLFLRRHWVGSSPSLTLAIESGPPGQWHTTFHAIHCQVGFAHWGQLGNGKKTAMEIL